MFHGHEDKTTMRSPGSGSDGSKCGHVFSPALRVKKPGSRVCHLHWFHIPLLIVLLAGQASCQTSPAPFLTTINAETSVHYSVHIIVDINGEEKNKSEIVAWLRQVFQNRLDDCRLPTTAIPTTPQTTSSNTSNETTPMMTSTLQNFNTTRPIAGATTSLGINTSTAAATTSLGINNTSTAATTLFKSNITTIAATSTDSISDNTSTVAATTSLEIHNMTTAAKSTALKIHNTTSIATTLLKSNNTTTAATTIASKRNITTTTTATTAKALEPFISSTTSSAAIDAPAIVRRKRALEIINPYQSHKQRVARQIGSSVGSGVNNENTPGLFQNIEVTCEKDSAIRDTSCLVTLILKHRVPPCCILSTLCAASKNSSEINVVGKRVDELSQIQNECRNETQMESSCKYSGPTGASCEEFGPAYVANQSSSAICGTNKKNCSCSDYCSGTDVFYTFEISIKDRKTVLSDVMSMLSKFEQRPDCADIPNVPCPLSKIVPEYKDVYVACGGGGANCRVLLRLKSKVHICDVSAAVKEVFQSEKQVSSNGLVTRAAICGEVGDNPLESPFRVDKVNLKPGNFCTTIEESNIIHCRNGTTVIVLLEERCVHRPPFTPGPGNVTNSPTSSPIIVTSSQMNTTALSLNTTTSVSNVTITATLNTTQTTTSALNVTVTSTLNTTQTTTSALNVTVTSTLNTTQTTTSALNVTVTSTLNTTQTTTNQSVPVSMTSKSPNVNTTASNVTVAATFNTTAQTLTTTTGASNVTVTATLNPTQTTTNDSVPVNTTNSPPTTLSAEGQAGALLRLTEDVSQLNSSQVERLVSDLERLLSGPTVSLSLGNTSVHIISNLLGASSETLSSSSTRIIGIVDTVALKLVLEDTPETLLSSAVALSVKPADGTNFQETVFSISDPSTVQVRGDTRVKRAVGTDSSIPQGSIRLPPSLTQNLTPEEQQQVSRVQFNFYQKSTVFQDQSLGELRKLNSGILGASAANLSITGLQEEVLIHLRNIEPVPGNFVAKCVFWDFTFNNRSGGWNENGCTVRNSTDNETVCGCNHLTSFAILLDLNRDPEITRLQSTILTFITYIGCGISCIFLSVTLLTYLAFEKLRKDIPSKILIQLCVSLLLLNMVFLVDAWLALYPDAVGLCISTAWFLHYFLLVTFTWMGLEAVHMYLALVKVFNTYVSRYMLKFSLVGWGVPMIVVIIVIAVDKDNYGMVSYGRFTDGTSDDFCWLKNDIAFYVAVVAYFCVIFVFNFIMFIVVLVQLCRLRRQNPHNMRHRTSLQDARSVCGITLLLGLTWGFAFFAWGPVNLPFMYLFAIFNSLQGFFIFVFHCAVKENVRKQWKTYLCCGGMRLPKNSEWSRTATQKTVKRSSVSRLTSLHSSSSNNTSSSSFLVSDSSEQMTGIGNPADDQAIRADEGANGDVILNELNRQQRTQQAP